MSRRPWISWIALAVLTSACAQDGDGAASDGGAGGLPQGREPLDLDPAQFTTQIDNRYWPMEPGTRWTYTETDPDGTQLEVVVTVSNVKREIASGVTAVVVRDTVTSDGELIEDTVDWYAQDAQGNIWYLGEETEEYENGEVVSTAGSWEAGVDGALPGVMVPAQPSDGMVYRQEYYAGEAEDNGEVLSTQEQVEVPAGHWDDALLTKDTNALEPNILEYKLYAPGVGPVLAIGVSGGGGREELISVEQVDEEAARAAGTTPLGEPTPEGRSGGDRLGRFGLGFCVGGCLAGRLGRP